MATFTYDDLTTPLAADDIASAARPIFNAAGFLTENSDADSLVGFLATALAKADAMNARIARTASTRAAIGDELTLHGEDYFDEARKPAVTLRGVVALAAAPGIGAEFGPGELIFSAATNPALEYTNAGNVIVPIGGTSAPIVINAAAPGIAYNVDGTDLQLVTAPAGIVLSVPPGTAWITEAGADVEPDDAYRRRLPLKWSTLTTTGPTDAYSAAALEASPHINRVKVVEDRLAVAPDPSVKVYIAGPTGYVSTETRTAAIAAISKTRPLGVLVEVHGVDVLNVAVRGTVKVKSDLLASTEATSRDVLSKWFAGYDVPMGGESLAGLQIGDGIDTSVLYALLMAQPGVRNVSLFDSAGVLVPGGIEISPTSTAVLTLIDLLTFEGVP